MISPAATGSTPAAGSRGGTVPDDLTVPYPSAAREYEGPGAVPKRSAHAMPKRGARAMPKRGVGAMPKRGAKPSAGMLR